MILFETGQNRARVSFHAAGSAPALIRIRGAGRPVAVKWKSQTSRSTRPAP